MNNWIPSKELSKILFKVYGSIKNLIDVYISYFTLVVYFNLLCSLFNLETEITDKELPKSSINDC
jgi:hypothetical protein